VQQDIEDVLPALDPLYQRNKLKEDLHLLRNIDGGEQKIGNL
jgi:hypothetical protein